MIRIEVALRLALFLGMAVPGLARSQDNAPAETAAPNPHGSSAPKVVKTPTGESINVDPTATEDPFLAYYQHYLPRQRATNPNRTMLRLASTLDALESKFGIRMAPVDEVLRSQLEIAKGQGVVVVEVKPGSLADQAGLEPRDLLLSLGDRAISGVTQARTALLGLGKEALEVKLIREGKPRRLSLVGPEHGFTPESSEFWIGVPVSPVDAVLRSHLAELPAETGLIANDVVKDSPADKAGVKKFDILVSMGGRPLNSPDSLIVQVQASGGKAVPLVVLRAGRPTTVEVTPTRRAHPTVFSLRPGGQTQFQVIQPHMAVEIVKDLDGQIRSLQRNATEAGEKARDIQIELFTDRLGDLGEGKVAAQLKELTARVEELRKAVEGLKKPEGK